ncbi:enoyl-CoA hydratase/isomerase family protein [bacterium]|nr:enoyl-CoA hydratase/isomerase family protein [bacterium]
MYQTIAYEVRDGRIAWIALDRPDVLNAMTDQMKRELLDAFKRADKDPAVRAIVLTGRGRGFCSGQDLADASKSEVSLGDNLRTLYNPLILQMRQMAKPIVCAVNGVAAGAGMSLALACDLRLCADNAAFIEVFVRIGLVPDAGSTWLLPRLVGLAKAFELAALGDKVDAAEALRLGLVNRVVPADQLEAEAQALASRLAEAPTKAIGLMKRAFERAFDHDLADQLEYEAHLQEVAGRTRDFEEGVGAFLAKRPPAFTGQ